jgi:hypothetical protein
VIVVLGLVMRYAPRPVCCWSALMRPDAWALSAPTSRLSRAKSSIWPEICERLLETSTDYARPHGLPDRLGPLETAAGTSPRVLLFQFAAKDGLLREVLHRARARQRQECGDPPPVAVVVGVSGRARLRRG